MNILGQNDRKQTETTAVLARAERLIAQANATDDDAEAIKLYNSAISASQSALSLYEGTASIHGRSVANGLIASAHKLSADRTGDATALPQAETHARLALEGCAQREHPRQWAEMALILGEILFFQQRHAEAQAAFRQALSVLTPATQPVLWGKTQCQLGQSLAGSIMAGQASSSTADEAINACRSGLDAVSVDRFPELWINTQVCLASVLYSQALQAQGAACHALLDEAIAAGRAAIQEAGKTEWALTTALLVSNVLLTKVERGEGERGPLLDEVVALNAKALGVLDRERETDHWMMSHLIEAKAHLYRVKLGISAEPNANLEHAIEHFDAALGTLSAGTPHHTMVTGWSMEARDLRAKSGN